MTEVELEDLRTDHARMEERLWSLESAEIDGRTVEGYLDELRAVRQRVEELRVEIESAEAELDLMWEGDPLA